ncbi:MAG TPA: MFS transporter [Chloroflexota bacterium]|nr:MFS transporter [Chloroflexota bacterium]
MQTLTSFRSFDRPVQVAILNMLANNVGFYMLVPFLAGYMANGLGLALWIVGLVLGIRVLTQEGMSLIGGSIGDRLGYRSAIVAGCIIRVVAFTTFGFVDGPVGMAVGAILTGLGGALLNPAVKAYLAHAAGPRRIEAFALLDVTIHGGSLLGPLIGVLLLGVDFSLVCFGAAAMFALVALLQWRFLPEAPIPVETIGQSIFRSWGVPLANRPFVLFCASILGYFFLYNQVYLGLPLEIRRLTGSDASIGPLFTMLAVVGILGQVPVTAWAEARLRPSTAIVFGLALMGIAFVPLLLTAAVLPIDAVVAEGWLGSLGLTGPSSVFAVPLALAVNLAPLALTCSLLIGGQMLAAPFVASTIMSLSNGRLVGTYFGIYAVVQGVGAALGNFAGGAAFDLARAAGSPGLPWALMAAVGLACAAGLLGLDRSMLRTTRPPAAQSVYAGRTAPAGAR